MPDREMGESQFVWCNFVLNVLDGALFTFALSFASRSTVLPLLVRRIGGENIAVGLIPVLWWVGFNVSQMLIAGRAERAAVKKPMLLYTAIFQRVPWLLLALVTWLFFDRVSTGVAILLFFVTFTLAAAGGGVNLPVWFDLISKLTPVRLRGRLFGIRTIVGSLLGILGGWVVEQVLDRLAYPDSYAVLVFVAFGIMMISYVCLTLLVEERQEQPAERLSTGIFWSRAGEILRTEKNFRYFLAGEALLIVAITADAFFTVDAFQKFKLAEGFAGRFTIVVMVSSITGSFVFGYVADRFGHRINLVVAGLATFAACLVALTASGVTWYYVAFACTSLTVALRNISRFPIVAELCAEKDRSTYVAISNVLTAPCYLAGMAAGWLADRAGYDPVFYVSGAFGLVAGMWFLLKVTEPRRRYTGQAE